MTTFEPHSKAVVAALAKEAGVAEDDARKILSKLGLDALIRNVAECGGEENLRKVVAAGDFKVAVRLGRSCLAV